MRIWGECFRQSAVSIFTENLSRCPAETFTQIDQIWVQLFIKTGLNRGEL
jgi:hypothetical protein